MNPTHRHPSRARLALLAVTFATTLIACHSMPERSTNAVAPAAARLIYPAAPRGETVDVYHGTKVADPYRWLEDPKADATRAFVDAQNALAQPWLEALPQRNWIKDRLTALWNYERVGVPRRKGGKYFFLRNDGRQNQSVLYVSDSLQGTPRVLFDPNQASGDATVA
jgi:prolyl oligopeptidase